MPSKMNRTSEGMKVKVKDAEKQVDHDSENTEREMSEDHTPLEEKSDVLWKLKDMVVVINGAESNMIATEGAEVQIISTETLNKDERSEEAAQDGGSISANSAAMKSLSGQKFVKESNEVDSAKEIPAKEKETVEWTDDSTKADPVEAELTAAKPEKREIKETASQKEMEQVTVAQKEAKSVEVKPEKLELVVAQPKEMGLIAAELKESESAGANSVEQSSDKISPLTKDRSINVAVVACAAEVAEPTKTEEPSKAEEIVKQLETDKEVVELSKMEVVANDNEDEEECTRIVKSDKEEEQATAEVEKEGGTCPVEVVEPTKTEEVVKQLKTDKEVVELSKLEDEANDNEGEECTRTAKSDDEEEQATPENDEEGETSPVEVSELTKTEEATKTEEVVKQLETDKEVVVLSKLEVVAVANDNDEEECTRTVKSDKKEEQATAEVDKTKDESVDKEVRCAVSNKNTTEDEVEEKIVEYHAVHREEFSVEKNADSKETTVKTAHNVVASKTRSDTSTSAYTKNLVVGVLTILVLGLLAASLNHILMSPGVSSCKGPFDGLVCTNTTLSNEDEEGGSFMGSWLASRH